MWNEDLVCLSCGRKSCSGAHSGTCVHGDVHRVCMLSGRRVPDGACVCVRCCDARIAKAALPVVITTRPESWGTCACNSSGPCLLHAQQGTWKTVMRLRAQGTSPVPSSRLVGTTCDCGMCLLMRQQGVTVVGAHSIMCQCWSCEHGMYTYVDNTNGGEVGEQRVLLGVVDTAKALVDAEVWYQGERLLEGFDLDMASIWALRRKVRYMVDRNQMQELDRYMQVSCNGDTKAIAAIRNVVVPRGVDAVPDDWPTVQEQSAYRELADAIERYLRKWEGEKAVSEGVADLVLETLWEGWKN